MAKLIVECVSNAPYLRFKDQPPDNTPLTNLTVGKRYQAEWDSLAGRAWLRVWDDFDEDYLYPLRMFRVVEAKAGGP
jgi:hypothetical protein